MNDLVPTHGRLLGAWHYFQHFSRFFSPSFPPLFLRTMVRERGRRVASLRQGVELSSDNVSVQRR